MTLINKNKFIAESATKNLAASCSNGENSNPDPENAVRLAIELWNELVKQEFVSEK